MRRKAFEPTTRFYVPVDELLAQPRTRVLRAIQHFDWIRIVDLFDVLGVGYTDRKAWSRYEKAVEHAHRGGWLVRRRGTEGVYEYRLADDVDLTIPPPNIDGAMIGGRWVPMDVVIDRHERYGEQKRAKRRAA